MRDDDFEILAYKACYRCGFVDHDRIFSDPDVINTCPHCAERAVISFDWALNFINDWKLKE